MSGNQPPPPPNFGNQPPPPPGQVPPPAGQVPPPAGGYQTPPPGGYGTPPTPGQQPWDLGSTLSWAWAKFQPNMGPMIIAMLGVVLPIIVIEVIGFFIVGALTSSAHYDCNYDSNGFATSCGYEGGTSFIVSSLLFLIVGFLAFLYFQIVGAGFIRASLGVTEGRPFAVSDVFKFDKIGPVVVTGLIVAALTLVGFVLCYLPGIIIAFLLQYSLFFLVDKNLAPMDAIKASFNMVKDNLGTTILWYIVGGLVGGIGAVICGIGLLFTLPIYMLGTAYTYKKLTGQPVVA